MAGDDTPARPGKVDTSPSRGPRARTVGKGAPDSGVVRIATLRPPDGQRPELLLAAQANANAARQALGCRSAEVCVSDTAPEILVVSRWASDSALREFLSWHQTLAHAAVASHIQDAPHAVHYTVASGGNA